MPFLCRRLTGRRRLLTVFALEFLFEGTYSPQPQPTMVSVDGFDFIDSIGSDEFELVLSVDFLYFDVGYVECF